MQVVAALKAGHRGRGRPAATDRERCAAVFAVDRQRGQPLHVKGRVLGYVLGGVVVDGAGATAQSDEGRQAGEKTGARSGKQS